MIEPTTAMGFLKIFDYLSKGAKWASRKLRLGVFHWRDRIPPQNTDDAIKAASSVLGGSIISAISFRSFDSKRPFLAVARRTHDEAFDPRIYVLERTGNTYTEIWSSDLVFGFDPTTLKVISIRNDGYKEVSYVQESFGSGAGLKTLYIYSLKENQVFDVTEHYNYQDASNPGASVVIKDMNDNNLRNAIIDYAFKNGFLQGNDDVNFDDPKFAILRWHKENGDKSIGQIKIHLYDGKPICEASITDAVDAVDITWIAYFKGPLYGYIKSDNKHFIAYSPQWVYEWVKSLVDDGFFLWFVCHGIPGLFSFCIKTNILTRYCSYNGEKLPDIHKVELDSVFLKVFVDETNAIYIFETIALEKCKSFCKLCKPHFSDECNCDRFPSTASLL